eukprot:2570536-Amphidinium_carterae.1
MCSYNQHRALTLTIGVSLSKPLWHNSFESGIGSSGSWRHRPGSLPNGMRHDKTHDKPSALSLG